MVIARQSSTSTEAGFLQIVLQNLKNKSEEARLSAVSELVKHVRVKQNEKQKKKKKIDLAFFGFPGSSQHLFFFLSFFSFFLFDSKLLRSKRKQKREAPKTFRDSWTICTKRFSRLSTLHHKPDWERSQQLV